MPKRYLGIDVLTAAENRINYIFDNFENITLSFSGGKDSTAMLHLVMTEVIKRRVKINILFIDLEAQYKVTIDHILKCVNMYRQYINLYWICLPIHLRNAVSVYEPFWICWDKSKRKSWVREYPSIKIINRENYFPFFCFGMEFEEFVFEFANWVSNGKKMACFIGIRAYESLNRFRTISDNNKNTDKKWMTEISKNIYNVYPLYDWRTEDIWIYQGKNLDKPYNKIYDLMYKAGLTINQMRICQPYGDDQRKGLWLFHLLEPLTWSKIVARVNGANGGALYIQETGNMTGYRKISKPDGHSWQSFAHLLISSMPYKTKKHYKEKINNFCKWWKDRGYMNEIPDEADYAMEIKRKVPSWRRVCKALLRNDYWFREWGRSQDRSEVYKKYLKIKKVL